MTRTFDDPFTAALERTSERYVRATDKPWQRHFTRQKLRMDPVTRAVSELGPLGDVLDIGCGRGQLALMLLELGRATTVCGSDWDEAKVALGNRASHASPALPARFDKADVGVEPRFEPADTVLLIDVLHYLDVEKQNALLRQAARAVRPGGRLVVREASRGYGLRSVWTSFVERLSRGVRFNVGERIAIRDVAHDYVPILEHEDLRCTVTPCWRGTPFSNVLLIGTRSTSAGETESGAEISGRVA